MDNGLRLDVEVHDGGRLDSKSGGTFGFTAQIAFMQHPRAITVMHTDCQPPSWRTPAASP